MWDANYRSWSEWKKLAQSKVDEEIDRGFNKYPFSLEQALRQVGVPESDITVACAKNTLFTPAEGPSGTPDVGYPGGPSVGLLYIWRRDLQKRVLQYPVA